MRILAALFVIFSMVSANAQTAYSTLPWGLNKATTPYQFGANIGGTWYNLGTVSSGGAWVIPNTNISGLGTASTQNTGTSGANVPLLNGINTWSGAQNFSAGATIPFTQSGTGAVAITVDAKLKQSVSVMDFGAACDNATDDSTAFNNAIQAIGATTAPGAITIPPGKACALASDVNINVSGIEIDCNGSRLVSKTGITYMINSTANYTSVHDCQMDGQNISNVGILIQRAYSQVYRNSIYSQYYHGVVFEDIAHVNCNNNSAYYNEAFNNGLTGHNGAGIVNKYCDYGIMVGNRLHNNGAEGMTYDASSYGYIAGNIFYANTYGGSPAAYGGTGGLGTDLMKYTVITGNIFQDNPVGGIGLNQQMGTSDHNTVSNNTFVNNATAPALSVGWTPAIIYLHTCDLGGAPPVGVVACPAPPAKYVTEYNVFSGNVTDAPSAGAVKSVSIDDSSNNNLFIGNLFNGTPTNTRVTDNGTGNNFISNY